MYRYKIAWYEQNNRNNPIKTDCDHGSATLHGVKIRATRRAPTNTAYIRIIGPSREIHFKNVKKAGWIFAGIDI